MKVSHFIESNDYQFTKYSLINDALREERLRRIIYKVQSVFIDNKLSRYIEGLDQFIGAKKSEKYFGQINRKFRDKCNKI